MPSGAVWSRTYHRPSPEGGRGSTRCARFSMASSLSSAGAAPGACCPMICHRGRPCSTLSGFGGCRASGRRGLAPCSRQSGEKRDAIHSQAQAFSIANRARPLGWGASGAMMAPRSSAGASATCWWIPQGWSCGSRSTARRSRTERRSPWCWRGCKRSFLGCSLSGSTWVTQGVARPGLKRTWAGVWQESGIPRSLVASGRRSGRSWMGRRSGPRDFVASCRAGGWWSGATYNTPIQTTILYPKIGLTGLLPLVTVVDKFRPQAVEEKGSVCRPPSSPPAHSAQRAHPGVDATARAEPSTPPVAAQPAAGAPAVRRCRARGGQR
jgi:hypothetical protein